MHVFSRFRNLKIFSDLLDLLYLVRRPVETYSKGLFHRSVSDTP